MNESERKARGERAKTYRDEFLGPIINDSRSAYQARIVEIATTELNPRKRAEKLTALSTALKLLNNIETGINALVHDGDLAARDLLRADKVERMSSGGCWISPRGDRRRIAWPTSTTHSTRRSRCKPKSPA
jgi:hypothetical protein